MSKIAVMIYGPPGSGKGTQANFLAGRKNFIHFDTGKYLEQLVRDPSLQKDKVIQRERKLFDRGILMTPAFVLKVVKDKASQIAQAGFSIVFSGSPRTLFEAFGVDADSRRLNPDTRAELGTGRSADLADNFLRKSASSPRKSAVGLIDLLEREYGKKNVHVIFLEIDPRKSIKRNKTRLVCSVCGNAMLSIGLPHKHRTCWFCGGRLKKRSVDNPKVFKTRIREYKERTLPILEGLKKRGYKILKVDGAPLPYKVYRQILKKLKI